MNHIKFSDNELAELQNFYRQEYNKTLEKLQNLKGILSKLKSTNGTSFDESTAFPKQARTRKVRQSKKVNSRTPSPLGRKLGKWPSFILKTISNEKKPLTTNMLFDRAKRHFNISDKNTRKGMRNLRGHLYRLAQKKEITSKKVTGQRDKVYGL